MRSRIDTPLRVLALTKYGARAASTRQRILQYAPFLQKNGIDIELRPLLDDNYLTPLMKGDRVSRANVALSYARHLSDVLMARRYDLLWVQYELFPYLPLIDEVLARVVSRPIVYDIDDAIFHMYDSHPSVIVRRLLGGKLRPLMRRAAVCLCGNQYLADYVEAAGGRAVVVPTVVDAEHFRPLPRPKEAPLTIGWIGSPSTWRYVEPLLPTLMPVMARVGARFHVIGAGPAVRDIAGIDAREWAEGREVAEIQAMDIGLMPVPDQAWARGKCGYKLIQYMACGLPGIASPVGVNKVIVEHGVNGFLAQTDEDWVRAVEHLAHGPALRALMGLRGRTKVIKCYSLESQQSVVVKALRTAVGTRR